MSKILVIEDDRNIADIVEYNLVTEGFEVIRAEEGNTGLELALHGGADLILLDVMLPGMDGFTILENLRKQSTVPVIMLTARESEEDRVAGFEAGADDYVPKPFSFRELMLRVRANLRRAGGAPEEKPVKKESRIRICESRFGVERDGVYIELSMRDYMLLKCLFENPDQIFSREELMEKVWGYTDSGVGCRMVDTAVTRLREKIEIPESGDKFIRSKRGAGYYYHED